MIVGGQDTKPHGAAADKFDPIMLEVIRSLLIAIMDESEINLSRTAFSPIVYEVKDYCIGLLDETGRTIAQSRGSVPTFMADLGDSVADGLEIYGPDGIHPGDVLIMNYSDVCGQHLNNIVIYVPVHHDDKLIGFVASRAHWTDVGGKISGSVCTDSTEIFQEGLQLRTLKVYKRGQPDPEIMRVIRHNVRYPDQCFGDMDAQIAACELGRRRYLALIQKYGLDLVQGCIRAIWDQCEAIARERIRRLPDGIYVGESFLDSDGVDMDKTLPLKIKVIVKGHNITVDYSELAPQTPGPMNAGYSAGVSAAKVAIKSALMPTLAPNDGTFRPISVVLPPGTIMSAQNNAAMSLWTVTIKTIVDTILQAISKAAPELVPGAHHGAMGVFIFAGVDPATGQRYSTVDSTLGGWGGQPDSDGFSPLKTVTHGDTRQVPIEVEETFWPVLVDRYVWRPDSGGPGKFKGGLGLCKAYTFEHGTSATLAFERSKCPPWGLFGGGPGHVGTSVVRQPGENQWTVYQKATGLRIKPGGQLELLSGGGGGYGPPEDRDIERVVEDVRLGYVTIEGARNDYGVLIKDASLGVDQSATDRLRGEMRRKRRVTPDPGPGLRPREV
jgi:N-methylhydantoinase B